MDRRSVYDGGRCRSLVSTDTISGIIGAFCEKRRRMQVFFSSMDTADRSSFSLIVVMDGKDEFSAAALEQLGKVW